ncbi:TIGR02680 family protein [Pectinatus frisingensis]|uniref:TIGR02680 family protein n=1 Tax=Pectinatus frisingensis TaxID=865 RepID=UPI0018C62882
MATNKWQMNRAGILNYWYYDEAEFEFVGGRLLLRGSNGSGKSVTMQSLITILLDGVKRANRLDSFGSRARRIEDYLLGEKEISNYEDRTGYLYLEYKREHSDQYLTTGIGLHARRGTSKVDFWGFILQNGQRVNKDLFLYKADKDPLTGKKVRVPLSRRELENRIGQNGRVVTDQREYMTMVNQHIFGFETTEKYQELMQLLIQLRSPKLSRDFKPSVIYEILNESLPSFSDEDLRPLAETLENMERTKLSIEQLSREKAAFDRLCNVYDDCNRAALAQRSVIAKEYDHQVVSVQGKIAKTVAEIEAAKQSEQEAESRQRTLILEYEMLQQEQETLKENEAYKAVEEKKGLIDALEKEQNTYRAHTQSLEKKRQRELAQMGVKQEQEAKMAELQMDMQENLEEMEYTATDADFESHRILYAGFVPEQEAKEHFQLWRKDCQNYVHNLQQVRQLLTEYEQKLIQNRQLEQELGQENRQLDIYCQEKTECLQKLEQEQDDLVKSYYEWQKKYKDSLPFSHEDESALVNVLQNLFRDTMWKSAVSVLDRVYSEKQQLLNTEIASQQAIGQSLEQKENELWLELQKLKETKEVEPPRAAAYVAARAQLTAKQQPFMSFYEATEFRPEVSAGLRERIESVLIEAGIMDALILADNKAAQNLPETMYGNVLFSGEVPLLANTLFNYLEPVALGNGITVERIADVLGSIVIDDKFYEAELRAGTCINIIHGSYHHGVVAGRAEQRERAVYIGRQAREAYRHQQIEEKQKELQLLSEQRFSQAAILTKLAKKMTILHQAKNDFPQTTAITDVYMEEMAKTKQIEMQEQRVSEKDAQKKTLSMKLRKLHQEVIELRGTSRLKLSVSVYELAIESMGKYREYLSRVEVDQHDFLHAAQLVERIRQDVETIQSEVDDLRGEILSGEMELEKMKKRLAVLDQILQKMDAVAVEKRIAEIVNRLQVIPTERDAMVAQQTRAANVAAQKETEYIRLQRRVKLYEILQESWHKLLKEELSRGLVFNDPPEKNELKELEQEWMQEKPAENMLMGKVTSQYMRDQGILTEYRVSFREQVTEVSALPELETEDEEIFFKAWQELREKARRQVALVEADGQIQSPYQQRNWLNEHLDEQKNLLSEQDKKIYKEIIMNNIGKIISEKIYAAEAWIKKMNMLMQQSDTSSALRFILEWKPIRAEKENELDTAELVELLHADPTVLKDDDMEKMVHHFQARIDRARNEANAQERDIESFQTAVRNLLDYRQWFQFRLYYDQGEQIKRRELTDKVFFKFSGGEKAMAMYIPLFSAAYSRYLEAGPDAPYIITLDEAFAGVDERNIRDMFKLVEQLHFNYIMNSQSLWGDYDVVPALNIYELLRPANAPYVTVVPYHWNGHVRQVVIQEANDKDDS